MTFTGWLLILSGGWRYCYVVEKGFRCHFTLDVGSSYRCGVELGIGGGEM